MLGTLVPPILGIFGLFAAYEIYELIKQQPAGEAAVTDIRRPDPSRRDGIHAA